MRDERVTDEKGRRTTRIDASSRERRLVAMQQRGCNKTFIRESAKAMEPRRRMVQTLDLEGVRATGMSSVGLTGGWEGLLQG